MKEILRERRRLDDEVSGSSLEAEDGTAFTDQGTSDFRIPFDKFLIEGTEEANRSQKRARLSVYDFVCVV